VAKQEHNPNALDLPGINPLSATLRGWFVLTGFLLLTLPLMPVQFVLLHLAPSLARRLPHHYHRLVCRLLGIRLKIDGEVVCNKPVLVVANHVSWIDIPVISAVAPISFIAKSEVGKWPFISTLARLQRTVFVDRTRRRDVGKVTSEMGRRLSQKDALVLFAEGTSTDGNRVLPFKTALFAAAFADDIADVQVQTMSITYTHLHGIPLGRADRAHVGWYGDMEMADHAWHLLKAGPIDVNIRIGAPVALSDFDGRKALAQSTEADVRAEVVRHLRGR